MSSHHLQDLLQPKHTLDRHAVSLKPTNPNMHQRNCAVSCVRAYRKHPSRSNFCAGNMNSVGTHLSVSSTVYCASARVCEWARASGVAGSVRTCSVRLFFAHWSFKRQSGWRQTAAESPGRQEHSGRRAENRELRWPISWASQPDDPSRTQPQTRLCAGHLELGAWICATRLNTQLLHRLLFHFCSSGVFFYCNHGAGQSEGLRDLLWQFEWEQPAGVFRRRPGVREGGCGCDRGCAG